MILNGLRAFLKKGLRGRVILPFAQLWCYPLLLIHFLSEQCIVNGEPSQKKMTVENVNEESCGLDCIGRTNLHDRFLE